MRPLQWRNAQARRSTVLSGGILQVPRTPVERIVLSDVWTDVARMRTLNMIQARKGKEQHLCPMQFDIADRLIERWSNPGDVVYDPFAGIMTVPYCAVKLARVGVGVELNPAYWRDGVEHVESIARDHATPALFDLEPGLAA